MTPFYEGYARARQAQQLNERMAEPTDDVVVRPRSVGYRVGRGLVHLGAQLMGARVTTDEALDFELAA